MKNSESFKRELDLLESEKPGTGELSRLQQDLRRHAAENERSDQHQTWAWTRLRAVLQSPNTGHVSAWNWQRLFLPSLAGATLILLGAYLLSGSGADLKISITGSDLYANTFTSGEAQVIWVTGYNYIPSSYPIK